MTTRNLETMAETPTWGEPRAQSAEPRGFWLGFAWRRGRQFILSVWVLITASFFMIHLVPGDPVRTSLGPNAPQELVDARRGALGLEEPLLRQYLDYLGGLFQGDLGISIRSGLPVKEVVEQRLPATLELGIFAFALAVLLAVPLGVAMAALTRGGRGPRTEATFTATNVFLATIPEFVVAVGLVYLFGVHLDWLPVYGRGGATSYVIPVVALAIGPAAIISRILRVEMLTALERDYVRTARAKRLSRWRIYLRHAMPNALTASLTIGGLVLGGLIASTVLVENVLAWPGLGDTMVEAIKTKDYSMVQAVVLVYGVIVLLITLLVDVLLAVTDPRSAIREA